ncbi:hypothetical protein, partial [Escherichia coli]|uniref:hypothetical protein n=1 Tax=Escherichia coli TaxID=562 RepID=UPI002264E995
FSKIFAVILINYPIKISTSSKGTLKIPHFLPPLNLIKKTDLKYPKDTLIYHNIPCSHRRRQPQHRSAP